MANMPVSKERLVQVFDSDPRSDTEIGASFGVSKQTISAWRNGSRSPKKSKLFEIADYYHKDSLWFFGFDEANEDLPIPDEEDEQVAEIISVLRNLSVQKKAEALRYIRYLAESAEDE